MLSDLRQFSDKGNSNVLYGTEVYSSVRVETVESMCACIAAEVAIFFRIPA